MKKAKTKKYKQVIVPPDKVNEICDLFSQFLTQKWPAPTLETRGLVVVALEHLVGHFKTQLKKDGLTFVPVKK